MTILNILVHKDGATAISKKVTEDEAGRIAQDFIVQVEVDGAYMDYRDYVALNSEEPAAEDFVTNDTVSTDAVTGDTSTTDSLQVELENGNAQQDAVVDAQGDGVSGDADAVVTEVSTDAGSGE